VLQQQTTNSKERGTSSPNAFYGGLFLKKEGSTALYVEQNYCNA